MKILILLLPILAFAQNGQSPIMQRGVSAVADLKDGTAVSTAAYSVSSGGIPTGGIIISLSACATGYAEVAALNGVTLIGTLAANGDVGTSGGSNTITPAGTVSQPTFSGNALAGHVHTFTGSLLATHLHGVGTYVNGTVNFTPTGTIAWPAGVPTFTGGAGTVPAQTFTGNSVTSSLVSGGTPAGTISALTTGADSSTTGGVAKAIAQTPTFTGSALATHSHTTTATGTNSTASFTPTGTIAWPAGVPTLTGTQTAVPAETISGSSAAITAGTPAGTLDSVSGGTPAGTVSQPTFTGSGFDNRSAFVKVIFCKKN